MQCFQNALAYFVRVVSYMLKMFKKSTSRVGLIRKFGVNLLALFSKLSHFINVSIFCCIAMERSSLHKKSE